MKKGLSASQQDKIYMKMAEDELILKETLEKQLTAATAESNKAFDKISASIESVGKSIGEGLKLLAGAIGNNQASAVNPHPSTYAHYYPQQYSHAAGQAYPNHQNLPHPTTQPAFPSISTALLPDRVVTTRLGKPLDRVTNFRIRFPIEWLHCLSKRVNSPWWLQFFRKSEFPIGCFFLQKCATTLYQV